MLEVMVEFLWFDLKVYCVVRVLNMVIWFNVG